MIIKLLNNWGKAVIGLSIIIGTAFTFHNTYATNYRVDLLAGYIEQNIYNDKLDRIQVRIFDVRKEAGCEREVNACQTKMDAGQWTRYQQLLNQFKCELEKRDDCI